jgi:hypothetical protein
VCDRVNVVGPVAYAVVPIVGRQFVGEHEVAPPCRSVPGIIGIRGLNVRSRTHNWVGRSDVDQTGTLS